MLGEIGCDDTKDNESGEVGVSLRSRVEGDVGPCMEMPKLA